MTRVTPRCPYFGSCGGCQHQDVAYQEQIKQKSEYLSTLFHTDVSVRASPDPYNYRNRMDFFVSPSKLGLKQQGTHDEIVDVARCEILHERLNDVLLAVRGWVEKHNIRGSAPGKFEGFLRYVVLRGDEHQQQLTLTTTHTDFEELVDELAQELDIASVVWSVEDESTERSVGSTTHKIYGTESIRLQLSNKEFFINSHTFFQTSPRMAELVIDEMKRFVRNRPVHDVYCGVGVLGQCVAKQVIGVDNNESNIEQASKNAAHNNVSATYHCADAASFMRDQSPEVVIVDPPRAGLQTGEQTLLAANPQTILYLSCNPKTQARDLVALKQQYEVVHIEGFDFFAHTDHVECLVVLERKA